MIDELKDLLAQSAEFKQTEWEKLPDIGLYMDQVQTYLDRQLVLYSKNEKEKLMTSSMINNYIKDGLIPRAESKKYSPSHVALLIMIATLKQVLSMQDLKNLMADLKEPEQIRRLYEQYLEKQQQDMITTSKNILAGIEDAKISQEDEIEFLSKMALDLSIEARNRTLLSGKILTRISELRDRKSKGGSQKNVDSDQK
jgi:hypothetical protein